MSRGLVALLLVVTLVVSGGASALVSWAVTSAAVGAQSPAAGLNGEDGADGNDGADGIDGEPGAGGVQGAPGPRGSAGATGATGAKGPEGPQGLQGVQGTDGADAVLASVEMTAPDGSVPYTGGWIVVGAALNVEAAPLILVTWRLTFEPEHTGVYLDCRLRDPAADRTYAFASDYFPSGSSGTLTGSALINLSGDAALELVCTEIFDLTHQQWTLTGASAYAVTVAT